jgi:hypothetical protein
MMENYLTKAIQKLKPNSEFSYKDNDYSTINWIVLDGDAPTQKEIDAAIKEIKADEAQAETTKATAKAALLSRLGITAEEAVLLLS